ncbi:MAG: TonB-dependent receptor, partial [Rhodobacteraceae bacterium]|nr:TonB-dependent receptor [Paracoccaceae bacterium]
MATKVLRPIRIAVGVMSVVLPAIVAQAQDQAAQIGNLEEIVVTARAREERLQDIPLAITAFTSEDLQKRSIDDMRDVARLTPGFAFEEYSGSSNTSPVIRGATQIAGSVEQPVSFFLDGVYLPRSYITDIGFSGIERVEIVKGPQSARYGRNAFTGAVNYITRRPGDEWSGQLQGTLGDYSRIDIGGYLSGPVVQDKVGMIINFDTTKFDGSWKNPHQFCDINFSLGTDCRLGGYDKTTISAGAVFTPVDNLSIDVSYFNLDSKKEQMAQNTFGELGHNSSVMNCGQYNPDVRPAGSGTGGGGDWFRLYCGKLPVSPTMAVDPRSYGTQLDADFLRIGVAYDFNDEFSFSYTYGFVDAQIEANRFSDFGSNCDYFIPGACVFSGVAVSTNRTESHDGRLTYDSGDVRVSAGLLYSPYRDVTGNAFATQAPLTAPPAAPLHPGNRSDYLLYFLLGQSLTKNKITSPFAEVSVGLMDGKLRLGAEARYTHETRYQQALSSGGTGGLLVFSGGSYTATYNSFTPRITVDYNIDDDRLVYASAAKGVKSGGFNTSAFLPENRAYGEDSNWTYEIGSKNTFGNFRVNADIFLVKWKNQQIPAADPQNPAVLPIVITLNLGNTTSKGFEFEGAWAPNENFNLSGSLYYGDATYDQGTFHLNFARTPAICDNVVCPTNGEISGNQTPRAPRWMGALGAEWTDSIGGALNLDYYIRGDLSYQTKAYADEMNLAYVPSRTVANARLG